MNEIKPETFRKGRLFIVSAPSGTGKSTLCAAVMQHFGDIGFSISHTTRAPRGTEQNGREYYFVSKEAFAEGIRADKWAEWAEVHGNYYGTSVDVLDRAIAEGRDLILDIDVQGMARIMERYPESVSIFIMPPSFEALRQRLETRGVDSPEVIERRMENAKGEIACRDRYQHVIINDNLDAAIAGFIEIIKKERSIP